MEVPQAPPLKPRGLDGGGPGGSCSKRPRLSDDDDCSLAMALAAPDWLLLDADLWLDSEADTPGGGEFAQLGHRLDRQLAVDIAASLDEAAAFDANRTYATMASGPAAAAVGAVDAPSFPFGWRLGSAANAATSAPPPTDATVDMADATDMASDYEAHAFLRSWGYDTEAVEQKALKRALQEERRDVAEWIVARDRALLSQPDRFGRSVLWWAVYDGCEDTARWTVERGADTTFKETKCVGIADCRRRRLSTPTPPPTLPPTPPTHSTDAANPFHPSGTSVLSVACGSCSTDLCRFLVEHGAAGDLMQPGKAEEPGGSLYVDQTTVVRSGPQRLSGLDASSELPARAQLSIAGPERRGAASRNPALPLTLLPPSTPHQDRVPAERGDCQVRVVVRPLGGGQAQVRCAAPPHLEGLSARLRRLPTVARRSEGRADRAHRRRAQLRHGRDARHAREAAAARQCPPEDKRRGICRPVGGPGAAAAVRGRRSPPVVGAVAVGVT